MSSCKIYKNNNFNKLVKDKNKKSSLVYLYKDNCLFCKKFNQDWINLEKDLNLLSKCDLYKINISELDKNKLDVFGVKYVPTIIYYDVDNKFIEFYTGDKSYINISKYISENYDKKYKDILESPLNLETYRDTKKCDSNLPSYYLGCVELKY